MSEYDSYSNWLARPRINCPPANNSQFESLHKQDGVVGDDPADLQAMYNIKLRDRFNMIVNEPIGVKEEVELPVDVEDRAINLLLSRLTLLDQEELPHVYANEKEEQDMEQIYHCSLGQPEENKRHHARYAYDDMDNEEKCKKRGRPEKIIDVSNRQLWSMLIKNLWKHVKTIWEGEKYDYRADTLRVRLIRLAKKIPLFLLHKLHSKSKYKSSNVEHFKEAYLNTYKRFLLLLEMQNLETYKHWEAFKNCDDPPEFIEFWALHYPKSKISVLNMSKSPAELKNLLDKRNKTSLKGFMELSKINRVLFQTMRLLKKAALSELNEKAKGIIESFLKNETKFF